MSRIVFVSEMGDGHGHISTLIGLAEPMRAMGHDCVFIVSDIFGAGVQAQRAGFDVIPGPPKKNWLVNPGTIMKSHGDILSRRGYSNFDNLRNLTASWSALLKVLRPDLLILEYSPTARLAAGESFKTLVVGSGFTIPPPVNGGIPQFRPGTLVVPEHELLKTISRVQAKDQAWVPKRLIELFYGDKVFITILPELDPFPKFRKHAPVGPLLPLPKPVINRPSKDLFCYLGGAEPKVREVIKAVKKFKITGGAYLRDIDSATAQNLSTDGFKVFEYPQNIPETANDTKFILHHGGVGLSQIALALGRPQILMPGHIEQRMNAIRMEELGVAGVLGNWRRVSSDSLIQKLKFFIEEGEYGEHAIRVARDLSVQGESSRDLIISESIKMLG